MRKKPLLSIFNNWFEIIFSVLWIDTVLYFGVFNFSDLIAIGISKWLVGMGLISLIGFPGSLIYFHNISNNIDAVFDFDSSRSYFLNWLCFLGFSLLEIPFAVILLQVPLVFIYMLITVIFFE